MRKREVLLSAVLISMLFVIVMMSDNTMHGIKRYDCSLSEISPDYPIEVKDACRKLRAERYK